MSRQCSASYPEFERVKAAAGLPDLAFQEGVPGDFDLAMFTLGPAGAMRHRRAFTEATLAEIMAVSEMTGADTLFQIEVPAELVLLAKAPATARPPWPRCWRDRPRPSPRAAPAGTRFAVHLCLGDMNNRAFGTMGDVGPLVLLANEILRGWPDGRTLDLLHAPFAAADHPATTEPAFFAPLADLALPRDVRFAAGFAHESQPLVDQFVIRTLIEDLLSRDVVISAACGMGRRTSEAAVAVLERTAELCTA